MNLEAIVQYMLSKSFGNAGEAIRTLLRGEEVTEDMQQHLSGLAGLMKGEIVMPTIQAHDDLASTWEDKNDDAAFDAALRDLEGGSEGGGSGTETSSDGDGSDDSGGSSAKMPGNIDEDSKEDA